MILKQASCYKLTACFSATTPERAMLPKRQLTINILAAGTQALITGLGFFFLYRFVEGAVGIERLGVWSLVLGSVIVTSLVNLGLGSSVVKFVSMHLARGDAARAALVAQTAFLTLAAILPVVLFAIYPVVKWALATLPDDLRDAPALLSEALIILPYAMGSFWALSVASVSLGIIDGHHRIDLRSSLQICGVFVYLIVAFRLVPDHGLLGLAWAHLAQSVLLLLGSWIVAYKLLDPLPLFPWKWRWHALKEILEYSLKFQVIAIFWMLVDPLTRWLVSVFGGLAATGWLEYASRMVFQLRALFASAHQALVPTIARLQEHQTAMLNTVYRASFRIILYLVLLFLPVLIAATPFVSLLWHRGTIQPTFVLYAVLLFLGWFLNLLSNPAYFAYIGIGTLRWNVIGRITIGVLNLALGGLLGWLFGGTGVVLGFVLALIVGSSVTAVAYQREHEIRFSELVDHASVRLGAIGISCLALMWVILESTGVSWAMAIAAPTIMGLVLLLPAWRHPIRIEIRQWLSQLRTAA